MGARARPTRLAGRYGQGIRESGFLDDEDGGLKAHACATRESAVYRALRSFANQARFAHGDGGWVEFPSYEVEPGLYRAAFCEASFRAALGEVVG